MNKTKLFGLGGMQEIGKTSLIIEHDDEIVVIDSGIKFTNSMETGVQAIIPDYTYLRNNESKIVGLFITHGHEDHIGGIPHLLKVVNIKKIYAPKIAIEFIRGRLEENGINVKTEFIETTRELNVKSKNFEVDVWTAQHSIPDAFGIRVKTPNGSIFYTGDFRFDYTPLGNMTDFTKLRKMGEEKLDVLLSDSTNAFSPEHSPTEKDIMKDIERFIVETPGKVILTTFASQLTRIQTIIEVAAKHGRKIVPLGRSMIKNIDFAKKVEYINVDENTFIDKKEIASTPDNKLMIITTGSQGEERAGLARMATGNHAQIKLKRGDTIIFSSSPIPGNRIKVELLINQLYKNGVTIKEHRIDGMLHVSGHAYKDELTKVFKELKPKYFIPIHGSYRMSAAHIVTGQKAGLEEGHGQILSSGQIAYLDNHKLIVTEEKENVGPVYIDSNNAATTNEPIIKQRADLGENGFINIIVCIDKDNNNIIGRTRILSRGAIYAKNSMDLLEQIQRLAHGTILHTIKNVKDWTKQQIKENVKNRVESFFYKHKRRNPIIVTSILDYSKDKIEIPTLKRKEKNQNKKPD